MKSLFIEKGPLRSIVNLPSSKSYANRLLILGALKGNGFSVSRLPQATDVTRLVLALKKIGLKIEEKENTLTFLNGFPMCERGDQDLEVGEGGTTGRFLAALLLRGKCRYRLVLGPRLKDRPWDEFLQFANHYGAHASLKGNILEIQGPTSLPSSLEVDASRSTQFVSGIQLAFPEISVQPRGMKTSASYWLMTKKLVRECAQTVKVPLDWSSASYPMVFAALTKEIFFPDLFPDSLQADSKLASLLDGLGAIRFEENGSRVFPMTAPHTLHFDFSDCLDLFPALCFLAAHIEGVHEFRGLENLQHKESDRLQEMVKILNVFERKTELKRDRLFLHGHSKKIIEKKRLDLPDDHRLVMTGTLFLRFHSGGEVAPKESVEKSYPDFFDLLT